MCRIDRFLIVHPKLTIAAMYTEDVEVWKIEIV